MANYNGGKYLAEAIQSVLDQTYPHFEFIIVDDGSTDDSPAIIESFAQRHPDKIRTLLKRENEGQGESFNKGFALSRGKYICFVDSDDVWYRDKLRRLSDLIKSSRTSAIYQHNLFKWRNGAETRERYRALLITGDVFRHSQETRHFPLFAPTSALAFPRSVLEKVLPIPRTFRTCADGYLTRTSFVHGPVASSDECWGYYRIHGANNVFANSKHDGMAYRYGLLIPALNEYYQKQGLEFRFDENRLHERLKHISPFKAFHFVRNKIRELFRATPHP